MKTSKNTILITGGLTETGVELAKLLSSLGNKVIITGKNKIELKRVSSANKNIYSLFCDLASEKEVEKMIFKIYRKFPELNVLINNSGQSCFESEDYAATQCSDNLLSQYLAGIRITEELLPLFEKQKKATIIDVSLLTLGYLHNPKTFSTLHNITESYSMLLRHRVRNTQIEIPNLQSWLYFDQNSNPIMLALRLIEAIYNKRSDSPIADKDYDYVNTHGFSRNYLNTQIIN